MKQLKIKFILFLFLLNSSITLLAQTTISGTIRDNKTQQALPNVNITVVGSIQGTVTDYDGKYNLTVKQAPPFTITISYLGFHTEEVVINEDSILDINMIEEAMIGQEIVVSASRLRQRILLSPVTIEKMDARFIQQTASADFLSCKITNRSISELLVFVALA